MNQKSFIRWLNQKDVHVSVSLASGGAPAMSHSIALMDLLVEYNIKVDEIHGTSAGAAIASAYACLDVEYSNEVYSDGNKVSTACVHKICSEIVRYKNIFELSPNLLKNLFRTKKNRKITGIFYGKKMRKAIEVWLPGTFRDTHTDLFIYAEPEGRLKYEVFSKERFPDLKISHAIRASTAMHHLFEPELIEGQYYLDGALFAHTPLYSIYQRHKEFKRKGPLVIFCTTSLYPLNWPSIKNKTLFSLVRGKYVDKSIFRIFSLDLYQLLLDKDVYIFLFYPLNSVKYPNFIYHRLQDLVQKSSIKFKNLFNDYSLKMEKIPSKHPKFNHDYKL